MNSNRNEYRLYSLSTTVVIFSVAWICLTAVVAITVSLVLSPLLLFDVVYYKRAFLIVYLILEAIFTFAYIYAIISTVTDSDEEDKGDRNNGT